MLFTEEELEAITNQDSNSITDAETIRKIALLSIDGDSSLICKIKNEYSFCGLYPHIQQNYDIQADDISQNNI